VLPDADVGDDYLDFNITFTNPPLGTNSNVYIDLDTDRNAKTGIAFTGDTTKSGSDYWIYLQAGNNTAVVDKVVGTADANGTYHGTAVASAILGSTLGFNTWGVVVSRKALGNPTALNFWIKTTDGGQNVEAAPTLGTYSYPLS
jgi:hypothetical protein